MKLLPLVAAGVLVLLALVLLLSSLFSSELFPEYSSAHRGARVAVRAGCVSCHGAEGGGGTPNPGKAGNPVTQVPGIFDERMPLDELRQWIENGVSDAKSASESFQQARDSRLIHMPAYRSQLEPSEISDLTAFLALEQYVRTLPAEGVPEGESLARKYGCFTCHGELGQGGVENPGSLKGYIPGFFGSDFRALTRNGDPQDLQEWIQNGHSDFFWNQGFLGFYPGQYFTARQALRMPAYGDAVPKPEIHKITSFLVELMNAGDLSGKALLEFRPIVVHEKKEEKKRRAVPVEPTVTPEATPAETVDLFPPVRKTIESRCLQCHGAEKQKSGYRMDSRETAFAGGEIAAFQGVQAIRPGSSADSLVAKFLTAVEEDSSADIHPMPPKTKPPLFPGQIQEILNWIDAGAPWPEGLILTEEKTEPEPAADLPTPAETPVEAQQPPPESH